MERIANEVDDGNLVNDNKLIVVKTMLNNFINQMTSRLSDLEHDMGKIDTDHTNLFYDYKDYCNHNELKYWDLAI